MAKIKNWDKVEQDSWINKKRNETVFITYEDYYYVIVENLMSGVSRQYDNALTTYSDAKKSAVSYMKMNID